MKAKGNKKGLESGKNDERKKLAETSQVLSGVSSSGQTAGGADGPSQQHNTIGRLNNTSC